jgi:protein SCO1/2
VRKAFLIIFVFLFGCRDKFPVVEDFSKDHFHLKNQSNQEILFPDFAKGNIVLVNYIFTNCPDICPLSTNNLRLIQRRLKEEKIKDVYFISLSFDPENDTPEALSKFAEVRNLDLSNWQFLTGNKPTIDSIIKKANVIAAKSDSTIFKNGRKIFSFIHTDRIQLIDALGQIRKNYKGSTANIDEIVTDVKSLQKN